MSPRTTTAKRLLSGVLAAIGATLALAANAPAQPRAAGEAPTAALADFELRALESSAAIRAVESAAPLSTADYSRLVADAQRYAASVAGPDDAQFTRLSVSALSQAIASRRGMLGNNAVFEANARAFNPAADGPFVEQIWGLPELQKNYRSLMIAASQSDSGIFPITGPPSVARVVGAGSQEAPANAFADCVCVGRRIGSTDQFCCTGTLVSPNVIVTAGHCFFCLAGGAEHQAVVFFGSNTATPGRRITGRAVRHPQYNAGQRNDLALILLDDEVTDVQPRRIATTEEINRATFVRAVGFGNSDFASSGGFGVKRMVDVPVASICCCADADPSSFGCDRQLELVAGFVGLGPDTCNGDSGGPVYVLVGSDARQDSAWAIAGATSRATELATRPCGDGGIYPRLDQYLEFINSDHGGTP